VQVLSLLAKCPTLHILPGSVKSKPLAAKTAMPSTLRLLLTEQSLNAHGKGESSFYASSSTRLIPQSILDAGGEIDAQLSGSLYRHISKMVPGQILEVISRNPGSRTEVVAWCLRTGHELGQVTIEGMETVFWIRKMD
jgi:tRNA 2-thiouridine synthesizing protein A